jgi:hypothetical protein
VERLCFGCADAEDSVEHYAACPRVADVAASQLGLPRPDTPAAQLASFLLLELLSSQQAYISPTAGGATALATPPARVRTHSVSHRLGGR